MLLYFKSLLLVCLCLFVYVFGFVLKNSLLYRQLLDICDQLSLLVSALSISKAPLNLVYNNCKTWNHRTNQTGMDLTRSSVLSPAQSKTSSEVRLSYSRFCLVRSQKHPGLHDLLWTVGLWWLDPIWQWSSHPASFTPQQWVGGQNWRGKTEKKTWRFR